MKRIAIFGNTYQEEKISKIESILDILFSRNASLWIEPNYHSFLLEHLPHLESRINLLNTDDFSADFALSIGGDGTFLHAAYHVSDKPIPIIGINTGRLGFLADVSFYDVEQALDDIYQNHYTIEQRSLLKIEIDNHPETYYPYALNEISILKRDNSSMISIQAHINDKVLNTYEADGLIIATPTGSTAYSMSVGGPILEPDTQNFVITPVAAHSLTTRPLVINNDSHIEIEVKSRTNAFQVAIDGKSLNVNCDQKLFIHKAPFHIGVIKRQGHTFYETLRNKLLWGADKRI